MSLSNALVLFSGGQDSATALAWALNRFEYVETVGFTYGQRHHVEMAARDRIRHEIADTFVHWAPKLGSDHVLEMETFGSISQTAMTQETEIIIGKNGLPNTFVPGRNLAFLVFAAALGWRRNIGTLVGGMCETDFSGYPDCREDVLNTQMDVINMGMAVSMKLETPLMHLTKGQSWSLCEALGGEVLVNLVNEHSHTCYKGVREMRHVWGYGCGDCPACDLRAQGWKSYNAGVAQTNG